MARKRSPIPRVHLVIKLTLYPERDADLLQSIETTSNKAQMVIDALRGRPVAKKPPAPDEEAELRDAIANLLM